MDFVLLQTKYAALIAGRDREIKVIKEELEEVDDMCMVPGGTMSKVTGGTVIIKNCCHGTCNSEWKKYST